MGCYTKLVMLLVGASALGMTVAGCNQQAASNQQTEVAPEAAPCGETCGACASCAVADSGQPPAGCCGRCLAEAAAQEVGASAACPDCAAQGLAACPECASSAGVATTTPDAAHVNTLTEDRDLFHFLLQNHELVQREVKLLENGVETTTESLDPAVAEKIQQHVASMHLRVEEGRPIRMWDELYQDVFQHADRIRMEVRNTEHGVSVSETSDDPHTIQLIQAHAKVVSAFAERGFDEAQQNHEPPSR